jgi:hypothetical protein
MIKCLLSLGIRSKRSVFPAKMEKCHAKRFFQQEKRWSEKWKRIVSCFIQRVNLVVCIKCWGYGTNVEVWRITFPITMHIIFFVLLLFPPYVSLARPVFFLPKIPLWFLDFRIRNEFVLCYGVKKWVCYQFGYYNPKT